MIFLGVLVNTVAVIFGSCIGLIFKKGISKKLSQALMTAIGLCVIAIAVGGMDGNALVAILAMSCGTLLGTVMKIHRGIEKLGDWINEKTKRGDDAPSISGGFVSASVLFCIGAMTLIGCFESGTQGVHTTLYAKSLLDVISSTILAASMGVGVLFSAIFVLVFQGGLVLLSSVIGPFLSEPMIADITMVGSCMILALGLNTLGITKIKVANMLPALFIAPLFTWLLSLLPI